MGFLLIAGFVWLWIENLNLCVPSPALIFQESKISLERLEHSHVGIQ